MKVVRSWHRVPRKAVAALEVSKTKLAIGATKSLIYPPKIPSRSILQLLQQNITHFHKNSQFSS